MSLEEELAAIDFRSAYVPFKPDERDLLGRSAEKTAELRGPPSFVQQGSPTLREP